MLRMHLWAMPVSLCVGEWEGMHEMARTVDPAARGSGMWTVNSLCIASEKVTVWKSKV